MLSRRRLGVVEKNLPFFHPMIPISCFIRTELCVCGHFCKLIHELKLEFFPVAFCRCFNFWISRSLVHALKCDIVCGVLMFASGFADFILFISFVFGRICLREKLYNREKLFRFRNLFVFLAC